MAMPAALVVLLSSARQPPGVGGGAARGRVGVGAHQGAAVGTNGAPAQAGCPPPPRLCVYTANDLGVFPNTKWGPRRQPTSHIPPTPRWHVLAGCCCCCWHCCRAPAPPARPASPLAPSPRAGQRPPYRTGRPAGRALPPAAPASVQSCGIWSPEGSSARGRKRRQLTCRVPQSATSLALSMM